MTSANQDWSETGWRWLKFNIVGGIGIGVQLLILALLKSGWHLNYLWATALAVEAAVIHNYLWHMRFTWIDRTTSSEIERFLRFNFTTGVFSIVGNLMLMKVFVDVAHLHYLLANMLTIATCSLVNFAVSDRFVFRVSPAPE